MCTKCRNYKHVDQFSRNRRNKDGLHYWCKDCVSEYNRANYIANGDRIRERQRLYAKDAPARVAYRNANARNSYLKSRYRITEHDYNRILDSQGGLCANPACTNGPDTRNLDVDHDHRCCPGPKSCGKCVRALLCNGCNVSLGGVNDDVERLRGLIQYIKSFQ